MDVAVANQIALNIENRTTSNIDTNGAAKLSISGRCVGGVISSTGCYGVDNSRHIAINRGVARYVNVITIDVNASCDVLRDRISISITTGAGSRRIQPEHRSAIKRGITLHVQGCGAIAQEFKTDQGVI